MSKISKISTRGGDRGETSLLYGTRVPKDHARAEAYGSVDEAVSALGFARTFAATERVKGLVFDIQKELFVVGAELATHEDKHDKLQDNYTRVTEAMVQRLDAIEVEFDAEVEMPKAFVIPGNTPAGAALDLARTLVRRAERRAVGLERDGLIGNEHLLRYLNRLSDVLFILARYEEQEAGVGWTEKPRGPE